MSMNFQSDPFERRSFPSPSRQAQSRQQQTEPMPVSSYPYPNEPLPLTPWSVAKVIPDSIGSIDEIAKRLGRKRLDVRKLIDATPDLQEMIEDEKKASVERVMMAQYQEAMEGAPQAKESYIKMVSGFFSKKNEEAKDKEPRTQVIIQMDAPPASMKALDPNTGEVIEVDCATLLPVHGDESDDEDDAQNTP